MPSGLDVALQSDFSAGMFQSVDPQMIPPNGAYDIRDGVLSEEAPGVMERGGIVAKANTPAGAAILGVWDGYLIGGQRTVYWTDAAAGTGNWRVLGVDDATPAVPLAGINQRMPLIRRAVQTGGLLFLPDRSVTGAVNYYGGSRKTANYAVGTASITNGTTTATGAGTAWLANVDAGMLFRIGGTVSVVRSVTSDTALELVDNWAGTTAAGVAYQLTASYQSTLSPPLPAGSAISGLATVAGRLVVFSGNRIYFSPRNLPLFNTYDVTDYHELPGGAMILGGEGLGNSLLVFTTAGVWVISNMAFDLTDDAGNPQQPEDQRTKELVLWDQNGIASWRNALVVPCIDNVYVMDTVSPARPVADPIARLYRSYATAGNILGRGEVYRGHYLVPVLNSSGTWVDTLVCRLDGGGAWTRWRGYGGTSTGFAARAGTNPALFSANNDGQLLNATHAFTPAGGYKADHDGTTPQLEIVTRDVAPDPQLAQTFRGARVRYELGDAGSDNPTLSLEYGTGLVGAPFTTVSGTAPEGDGTQAFRWHFQKRTQALRLRVKKTNATSKLVLRSIELFYRARTRK